LRNFVLLFFLLINLHSLAQNISDVRLLNEGNIVTVSGIVTNGSELGVIRYMQDKTGGLAVYDTKLENVKRGDSITVTGEIDFYNNLLELVRISNLMIHSSNHRLPEPKVIGIEEIGEDYEGQLVEIKNVEIEGSGNFAGNKNYSFSAGALTSELRINTNSPIVGQIIPSEKLNLTAICSQYSFENNDTRNGYQLLPRDMEDLVSLNKLAFTSPVWISNINNDGFTLSWTTNTEVKPYVFFRMAYSSDPGIKKTGGTSQNTGGEYLNSVTISGLAPATLVRARAINTSESDTISSPEMAFVTTSVSSGEMKVYFNTPVNENLAKYTLARDIGNALEDTLIAYIGRARKSIDFCMYNFSNGGLSDVSEALNQAFLRGVRVRVITTASTSHAGTDDLLDQIHVLERPENNDDGIMHNKFVIFDVDEFNPDLSTQNQQWVCTGSTNLTYNQVNTDANHMIFIQDKSLALAYLTEFEEMWGSSDETPNAQNAKFGEDKTDNTPHEFIIGGNRVQCYFSPTDNTNQKIINALKTADYDLSVQTMLITRSDLAWAIADASKNGAEVRVLTNFKNDNSSIVNQILSDEIPSGKFVFDDNAPGILHHKLAIIDAGNAASDPQVITGSHNWSNSANTRNDENTLIIHNEDIANQYFQQFAHRFVENGGNLIVSALKTEVSDIRIFPNPTQGRIYVTSGKSIARIKLFGSSGELVFSEEINNNEVRLNLGEKPGGIYILNVSFENGEQNRYKIIKTK
jgi:phosphatidylserine/phosphatidylglycerophosphate/cardiolipin synthase-like enzyme